MIGGFYPAVRIGFSSNVYEVSESSVSVNVQVVKNGTNDIVASVLFNTMAGSALGNYIYCTGRRMISEMIIWSSLL